MQRNKMINLHFRRTTLEEVWRMIGLQVDRGKTEGKKSSQGTILRVWSIDEEGLK